MRWCPLSWALRWARCLRFRFLGISLGHPFLFAWFFVCTRLAYGGAPFFCVFLFVGVAGDFVGGGAIVAGVVGEDASVSFIVGGFDGDGAGGGSVFVGGFGAAVDDLAVVDEVFVGCGDGFGVHDVFLSGFLVFPPYHSTHMIHKFGVG